MEIMEFYGNAKRKTTLFYSKQKNSTWYNSV